MSPAPLAPGGWMAPEERAALDYLYDHHREHLLRSTRDWAHTDQVVWALNNGGFLRSPEGGISDHETWADMTDAQRWAYTRRLEDAVKDMGKELGLLRRRVRESAWCEKCNRVMPPGGSPTCVACGSEGSTGGETAPD